MPTKLACLLAAAAVVQAGASIAQPTQSQRPDCSALDYRQLDFWVGEWTVFNTQDNVQYATSRVEKIMNGCAIKESYESPKAPGGPYSGTSYSSLDRKDGKWHQMYVDVNGTVTWYTGALEAAGMTLDAAGPNGTLQRMTYSPQADGSVRQVGRISKDQGKTWQVGYDYTYRQRNPDEAATKR